MDEKPEALRLADLLEKPAGSSSVFRNPAAAELRRLHAEVEENDRNLCQLTDELAKTVALLRQAWAVIRWQCFGECRTEGVDGLPPPSEVDIAIREHLNKSKQ